jgi:ABC transporter substrate binding protein
LQVPNPSKSQELSRSRRQRPSIRDVPQAHARPFALFQQSLQELGWKDGRNIRIDYRWGDADADRIQALAKELVGLQPDVLVAHSTPSAKGLLHQGRTNVEALSND